MNKTILGALIAVAIIASTSIAYAAPGETFGDACDRFLGNDKTGFRDILCTVIPDIQSELATLSQQITNNDVHIEYLNDEVSFLNSTMTADHAIAAQKYAELVVVDQNLSNAITGVDASVVLLDGKVTVNKNDIQSLNDTIKSVSSSVSDGYSDVQELQNKVFSLESNQDVHIETGDLVDFIGTHDARITCEDEQYPVNDLPVILRNAEISSLKSSIHVNSKLVGYKVIVTAIDPNETSYVKIDSVCRG